MIRFAHKDLDDQPLYFCFICWKLYTKVKAADLDYINVGPNKAEPICKKCVKIVEKIDGSLLRLELPKIPKKKTILDYC